MQCRQATTKDIPALIELMRQLGYSIDAKALKINLSHYGASALVLEKEGKIIGCLAYHILPLFHVDEKHMRVVSLVIDQQCRGQGCGTHLLQAAEKLALSEGCAMMELTSAAHRAKSGTHAFYEARGYIPNGDSVYFRKPLSGKDPEE